MSRRSTAQPSLCRLRGEREEVGGEGGVGGAGSDRREVGGQARGGEAEGREGRAESPVQGGVPNAVTFSFVDLPNVGGGTSSSFLFWNIPFRVFLFNICCKIPFEYF